MQPACHRFKSEQALFDAAAQFVADCVRERLQHAQLFSICLAGGETPCGLYTRLAEKPYQRGIPWERVHLFWGDERFVPHDHAASNFGMAKRWLLSRIQIPSQNIHAVETDVQSPEMAALDYEIALRHFFEAEEQRLTRDQGVNRSFPQMDLILLGLGADGHTASLFPGDGALFEEQRWVVSVAGERADPPVPRMTLTLPVLSSARRAAFLVTGMEKQGLTERILSGEAHDLPAARVKAQEGIDWFVGG